MFNTHPYSSLSVAGLRRLFLLTVFLTGACGIGMRFIEQPLITESAPLGIVSFELASDIPESRAIINSWDATAQMFAGLSLGVDFLFLLLYSLCISSACALVSERLKVTSTQFSSLGRVMAWVVLLAGLLDVIENFALIRLLSGAENPTLPVVARWSAIPKFTILIMGVLFIAAGGLYRLIRKSTLTLVLMVFFIGCTGSDQENPGLPFVVAFGSCVDQAYPAAILDVIAAERPDVFILTGDNIYSDTEDPAVMKANYQTQASNPALIELWNSSTIIGTWDDHDYGASDGGSDYPMRREAQILFADFFRLPESSPVRSRDGVYDAYHFESGGKSIQVILLDTRFFRGPLTRRDPSQTFELPGRYVPSEDTTVTMLGEAQWTWLEEQFLDPADIRLLVSSVQFVPDDHGWEKWANLPHEKSRLLNLIESTRAEGILILSGDRHLAEISVLDTSDPESPGYPLYDVTSSALNKPGGGSDDEPNRHRFSPRNFREFNYGRLTFFMDDPDPRIDVEIVDSTGTAVLQHSIRLSELRF